jgi:hypothetical protein
MAKIKFGMMMTDARGKLGGQVFSKNKGGAYVRTKVTPTNPQTTFQTGVRTLFALFSQQWSGLSDAARSAWDGAVSNWSTTDIFGDLKNPTGKSLFLRLNQRAVNAGYTSFTAVPAKAEMVEGICTEVEIEIGASSIVASDIYTGSGARVVFSATPVLSAGTTYAKNRLRDIYNELGSIYDSVTLYEAYVARFGVPAVGANIYFGIKYVLASGQSSPVQTIKAVVIA